MGEWISPLPSPPRRLAFLFLSSSCSSSPLPLFTPNRVARASHLPALREREPGGRSWFISKAQRVWHRSWVKHLILNTWVMFWHWLVYYYLRLFLFSITETSMSQATFRIAFFDLMDKQVKKCESIAVNSYSIWKNVKRKKTDFWFTWNPSWYTRSSSKADTCFRWLLIFQSFCWFFSRLNPLRVKQEN